MKLILWVEDDAQVRKTILRSFGEFFTCVDFAFTGERGVYVLSAAFKPTHAAVVSDFDLGPGPTGADVLAAAERAGILVRILCSGDTHGFVSVPSATGFYSKFRVKELVEKVLLPLCKEDA